MCGPELPGPAGQPWGAEERRRPRPAIGVCMTLRRAEILNSPGDRYGPYRIWGALRRSRYFRSDGQPDITTLIRRLSVRAGGDGLGRAFQGRAVVRRITEADHRINAPFDFVRAGFLMGAAIESLSRIRHGLSAWAGCSRVEWASSYRDEFTGGGLN
jgi:hypothetical protein